MAIKNIFKSRVASSKFVFKNGKEASFVLGKYFTDVPWEIKELESEIESGHPHLYVDKAEATIDSDLVDPLEDIRKKAVADYIARMSKATQQDNDMGETVNTGKLEGIANSDTISEGAASSDGAVINVALTGLKAAVASKATAVSNS